MFLTAVFSTGPFSTTNRVTTPSFEFSKCTIINIIYLFRTLGTKNIIKARIKAKRKKERTHSHHKH